MIIIGIAGGTGSGKTTVVRRIIESLSENEVAVLPLDSYYKDSSHVPVEERQNINFDHPSAFDWDLLSKHISMLRKGEAIEQPVYSYLTCTRQKETVHVEPRKVIIIEGILALSDRRLCKQMDLRIFVDADPDERLIAGGKAEATMGGQVNASGYYVQHFDKVPLGTYLAKKGSSERIVEITAAKRRVTVTFTE